MGSGQTTHQRQSTNTSESALMKQQTEILKSREQLFQNWYLPEIKSTIDEFDPQSAGSKSMMNQTAKEINSSFDAAQKQTSQTLAQQNLLGSGAGMALTAANDRARASALADAYANQMATSAEKKANLLSNMATLMPSTTNAAPTLSSSTGSSNTRQWSVG